MERVRTPEPPTPTSTRPMMKTVKFLACAVTSAPTAKKKADVRTMAPGEKIMARRPTSGDMEAMVMR